MINTYYTPKLEEFHIGFEYEFKEGFLDGTIKTKEQFDAAKWVSATIKDVSELAYIDRALNGRNAANGICGIRVQNIDHEDICLLEWIPISSEDHNIQYSIVVNNTTYSLIASFYDNHFLIMTPFNNKENDQEEDALIALFQGTLNNKNELEKIMKQVFI